MKWLKGFRQRSEWQVCLRSFTITPKTSMLLCWQDFSPNYFVFFKKMIKTLQVQKGILYQFSSVQSLSRVGLFATPWISARQASLSITSSQSFLKLMPIELVMPSSHLILCRPLLLLPPIPPSIRVFSNESTLRMRWPKYCIRKCKFQNHQFPNHPTLSIQKLCKHSKTTPVLFCFNTDHSMLYTLRSFVFFIYHQTNNTSSHW